MSVPTPEHVAGRKRDVASKANIALRSDPKEDPEDGDDSDDDDLLPEACKCFCGTRVPEVELGGMTQRERFANLHFVADGLWIYPQPAQSPHAFHKYAVNSDDFGKRAGLESETKLMATCFHSALESHKKAVSTLSKCNAGISTPSWFNDVEEGISAIQNYLDTAIMVDMTSCPAWAMEQHGHATRLRTHISDRMQWLKRGQRHNEYIQNEIDGYRQSLLTEEQMEEQNRPTLRSTFTTDDLFKNITDHFGPYDAGHVLQVCKWDRDIHKLLRARFPKLHIYNIPGIFPHHVDAAGAGFLHAQTLVRVAVGLVYTKKREPKADGTYEQDPGEQERPGVQCFDAVNTVVGAKMTESYTGYDQPWNAEFKRYSIHPLEFFTAAPTLTITLIDAVTDEPVIPLSSKELHGGLDADKMMACLEVQGRRSRLMWSHTDQNPSWRSMQGEDFATMSKYKVESTLSSQFDSKFKIRATIVGPGRHGDTLRMSTTTEPMTIVSSLAVAKRASYTRKRKRGGEVVSSKRQ